MLVGIAPFGVPRREIDANEVGRRS